MGLEAVGEVPADFDVFAKRSACRPQRKVRASKRVDNFSRFSPLFREQPWQRVPASLRASRSTLLHSAQSP